MREAAIYPSFENRCKLKTIAGCGKINLTIGFREFCKSSDDSESSDDLQNSRNPIVVKINYLF